MTTIKKCLKGSHPYGLTNKNILPQYRVRLTPTHSILMSLMDGPTMGKYQCHATTVVHAPISIVFFHMCSRAFCCKKGVATNNWERIFKNHRSTFWSYTLGACLHIMGAGHRFTHVLKRIINFHG